VPIQVEIFHFDRLVVGIGRGVVTLAEYGKFVTDLIQQGLMHYRKIIDVTSVDSSPITEEILLAFDARLKEYNKTPRGPLAVVARRDRNEIALAFKAITSRDRPIEIFRGIHEARAWLARQPVADIVTRAVEEPKPVEEEKEEKKEGE
jgi:hypothetical protein